MKQTDTTLTPATLEVWRALDEIDQDPCIGELTEEQKKGSSHFFWQLDSHETVQDYY